MDKKLDFVDWLWNELDRRSWSQAQLARKAEVTRSVINSVLNRKSFPGVEVCRGIAYAFSLPPEEVFRKAGLLPDLKETKGLAIRTLAKIMEKLTDEQQEEIINYAEYQLSKLEQKK